MIIILKRLFCLFSLCLLFLIGVFVFSFNTSAITGTNPPQVTDYSYYFTSMDNLQYIQWSFVPDVKTSTNPEVFFTDESFSYPATEDLVLGSDVDSDYTISVGPYTQTFYYYLNSTSGTLPNDSNAYLYTDIQNLYKIQLNYGPSIIRLDPSNFTTFKIGEIDSGSNYDASVKIVCKGTRITFDNDGNAISSPFTLIQTQNISISTAYSFNIYSLFSQSFANYAVNGYLNISSMQVDIDIRNDLIDNNTWEITFYWRLIRNTFLPTTDDWFVFEYDVSQLGTSLLRGATNFLRFEIFPGFTLLNLLYLIIAVPLLLAILRLFLGG